VCYIIHVGNRRNTKSTPVSVARINWQKAREWYVTSEEQRSYQDVANEFHVSKRTVVSHAVADGWIQQREQYRHMVAQKTREKTSTLEAAARAKHTKFADAILTLATKKLKGTADLDQVDLSSLSFRDLVYAIREACEIERKALGLDSDRVPEDIHITFRTGGRLPGGGCVKTDNTNVTVEQCGEAEGDGDD